MFRSTRPAPDSSSTASIHCGCTTPGLWRSGPRHWKKNEEEAVALQSREVYDRYMKYLTGCAELFREGYTDICQFTLAKG